MPKKEQTIATSNIDKDTALSISYEVFKNLNWQPQYAGPEKLLGSTPKKWGVLGQQIIISAAGNQLSISSEMMNNELMDFRGRNKKNIAAFTEAFQTAKSGISPVTIEENIKALNTLREETEKVAEEQTRQAAEADAVMNFSKRNLAVTYTIMAINVLVFIAMCVSGVSVFEPGGMDIIRWGGNYGPLTASGEWWRLLTNVFVHIGIIHIAFNMYALYMVGVYLEPMLGKIRYIVAYLCTGILASVASLWWHSQPTTSAGASGAIFGLFGVFLAMLSTNIIPANMRKQLLQSILIFVGYNLVYGLKSGVDNSAHIGGLISGLAIGYIYYLTLVKPVFVKNIPAVCAVIVVVTLAGSYAFLHSSEQHLSSVEMAKLRNEIKASSYKDADKYNDRYNEIIQLQDEALAPLKASGVGYDGILAENLRTISVKKWQKAQALVDEMKTFEVPENLKTKTAVMEKYIHQRQQEVDLLQQIIQGDKQAEQQLDTLRNSMNESVEKLQAP